MLSGTLDSTSATYRTLGNSYTRQSAHLKAPDRSRALALTHGVEECLLSSFFLGRNLDKGIHGGDILSRCLRGSCCGSSSLDFGSFGDLGG